MLQTSPVFSSQNMVILSDSELQSVAQKIFQNEAGGDKKNLIVWNEGENFPSLGIGHFIWYKKNEGGIFKESFPDLITYMSQYNVSLPSILRQHQHAPWRNRDEFLLSKQRGELDELEKFLYSTQHLQIAFIYQRLQQSLEKMIAVTPHKTTVRNLFYRVASAPNGLYALIDYVNFKGEGINLNERYNDQGWGLLQVLENMQPIKLYKDKDYEHRLVLESFRHSAKEILTNRVNNSDPKRNEQRWLQGWLKRCDTYR